MLGYDALLAGDSTSAIAVLSSSHVDAVILDVRLVGHSGLEVLEFVRSNERYRNLPVLILTGISRLTNQEEETIRRNEALVFYKPQGIDEIGAELERLFRR